MKINLTKLIGVAAQLVMAVPTIIIAVKPVIAAVKGPGTQT